MESTNAPKLVYIHGTNSKVLNILSHTDFEFMSPYDMMANYGLAPFSGEITKGGHEYISSKCDLSFGICHFDPLKDKSPFIDTFKNNSNVYSLEKILREYSNTEVNSKTVLIEDNYLAFLNEEDQAYIKNIRIQNERQSYIDGYLKLLKDEIQKCKCRGFGNINVLLIRLVRCKQLGLDVKEYVTQEILDLFTGYRNIFAFMLFLDKYIFPISPEIKDITYEQYESTDFIKDEKFLYRFYHPEYKREMVIKPRRNPTAFMIYNHLTMQKLMLKLKDCPYDLLDCYKKGDPEAIKYLISLLELPKTDNIYFPNDNSHLSELTEITIDETKIFTDNGNKTVYDDISFLYNPKYLMSRLPQNTSDYAIDDLLCKYYKGNIDKCLFTKIKPLIYELIDVIDDRKRLLVKLLNFETKIIQDDENPYPIILVLDNPDLIDELNGRTGEYRAKRPLKLGEDIKILATDTEHNKSKLKEYLDTHNITNVDIKIL